MAVIDLKNENKIIIIQNDIQHEEKVLTHPNNEPIFRQNGYEPNGLKSSFAIRLNSSNSEYLEINKSFLSNSVIEIDFIYVSTNSDGGNTQTIFSKDQSGLSRVGITISTGVLFASQYTLTDLFIDNVSYPLSTDLRNHFGSNIKVKCTANQNDEIKYIGSLGASLRAIDAIILGFVIDNTTYPLTVGLGNTTNGATINTSHADGIKRINFGMWLKGNDIDGWNPYTIV